jgi:hypothetical protein
MYLVEWMECGRIWALAAELCLSHLRDVSATKAKCVHNTLLCANLAKNHVAPVFCNDLYCLPLCNLQVPKKIPLQVYAVDASEEAAAWARHNVRRYNLESRLHVSPCCILGVEFLRGTWKLEFRRYRKN